MSPNFEDPPSLDDLLAGVPPAARMPALMRLARQFDGRLKPTEARLYDQALLRLARVARLGVRTRLANRLAPVQAGPVQTVSDLALDLEAVVAAPVLRRSPLVSEEDLVTVTRTRGQDHLAAVAGRRDIRERVTDGLAARGHWPVLRLLAANRTAKLSWQGRTRLVALAFGDGHIAVALTKREDISAGERTVLLHQFKAMIRAKRSSLRGEDSGIDLSRPTMPLEERQAPVEPPAASTVVEQEHAQLSVAALRTAEARVEALINTRPLTRFEVTRLLAHGHLADAAVVIGRLAGEDPLILIDGFTGGRRRLGRSLLMMAAAGLNWNTVEEVARLLTDGLAHEGVVRPGDLAQHRAVYEALTAEAAKGSLWAMRRRASLRVIEGGRVKS